MYKKRLKTAEFAFRDRLLLIFVGFLYLLILHFSYKYKISYEFTYMGYIYLNPPIYVIVIAWLTSLTPLLWMPVNITRPSQIIYWFLYILVVVPVSIVPAYITSDGLNSLIKISCPILISFAFMGIFYKFPLLRVKKFRIPQILFWWIFTVSVGFLYLYILRIFGSRLTMVNPLLSSEVYEIRLSAREVVAQSSIILGYLMTTISEVVNPFLISLGLYSKRIVWVIIGFGGQILMYMTTAAKGIIFSPFLLFGLFLILRKSGRKFGTKIFIVFILLVILSVLIDVILSTNIFTSLIVRRGILTHGLLTTYYFDFFSINPKAHLGYNRILQNYINYPYSSSPPFIIGEYYFRSPYMSANENFWAQGFADFGYFGVFFLSIIVAIILWFYDSVSKSLPLQLSALLLILPGVSLASSSFFTSMLTHNIMFLLVFIYVIPKSLWGIENEKQKDSSSYYSSPTI
jgi:hypothetical protein